MAVTKETLDKLAHSGKPRSRWLQAVLDFTRQRPIGALGAVIILAMVFVAIGANWLAPFDALTTDYGAMLVGAETASTGSAPTRTAATSCRASSSARAPR